MKASESYPDKIRYEQCVRDIEKLLQKASRIFQMMERDHTLRTGYTTSQSYVIELLSARGTMRVQDVAESMKLDKSSASRLIQILVRDGLVDKSGDLEDKRVFKLTLTEKGRQESRRIEKLRKEYYSDIIEKLPQGHVREVMSAAETLVEAIEN